MNIHDSICILFPIYHIHTSSIVYLVPLQTFLIPTEPLTADPLSPRPGPEEHPVGPNAAYAFPQPLNIAYWKLLHNT